MKHYCRPLALLWGPDARDAIAAGRAGRLGGSVFIAFAQAELIEREGRAIRRSVVPYRDIPDRFLSRIEAPRSTLCGLALDMPKLMGIVNVTPDSFSDGGQHASAATAIAHGRRLAREGAHILDVGGESTRPNAVDIAEDEEIARVSETVAALAADGYLVSIDTRKALVMEAAAARGARIVNDVSALHFDPASLSTVVRLGLPVILMHAQGTPQTMQINPTYDDVALDVYDMLEERTDSCISAGISRELLVIDPGIGFGKTSRHNVELMRQLTLFHGLGLPIMMGLSRKGFTGALTGEPRAEDRVYGSLSGAVQTMLNGAQILRVHDVKATRQALAVAIAAVDPEASGL
jgi:dihydropteroate synthase